jgi:hypothetical protein
MGHNATNVTERKVPDMADESGPDAGAPTTPLLVTEPQVDGPSAAGAGPSAPVDEGRSRVTTDPATADQPAATTSPAAQTPSTSVTSPAARTTPTPAGDRPDPARGPETAELPPADAAAAPPGARGWRALDTGPRAKPWRVLSIVLLVLGCVFAPLGVTTAWAKNLVTNQNDYLDAVGPLISDPVIINAAEGRIVQGIDTAVANLNLSAKIGDELKSLGLPPQLASIATTYLATFRDDINERLTKVVDQIMQSPRLVTLWNEANIRAHTAFVDLMQGRDPGRLSAINLDLSSAVAQVKTRLADSGVQWASQIPDVPIVFNLTGNADIQQLSGYYDALVALGTWLPIVAIVMLLLSVVLAPSRLRGLSRAGGWLAFSMVVLAVALIGGREWLTSQAPAQPQVTQAFTRQLTVNLQTTIRWVAVIGAVIGVLAWLFGRSRSATSVRRFVRGLSGGVQDTRWQWVVRIAAGAVAVVLAIVLLTLDNPRLIWAVLLAVGTGLAALIALAPRRRSPDNADAPAEPAAEPATEPVPHG